jgi:hypothetical protein
VSGWTETLAVGACVLLLAGCQDHSHEGLLEDYVTRIARVSRTDTALPAARPLPPYPPRRALTLDIPRRNIDVVEFLELHGCDMGALVGLRNSPLGRLQSASQRLGYETAWLAAAERCGVDAAEWMTDMGSGKREWLPALFWNATFGAEEMRVAVGASAPPAKGDLADILRGLSDSLTRVEEGGLVVDDLERLLGRLRQGSWVGPARRDWSLWRRYLDAASAMLAGAAPRVCLNRKPTPRTDRLRNVFMKLYVQQIQPELARRLGEHEGWLVEVARLSHRLRPVQPAAYRNWFRVVLSPHRPESEWRRTRQAVVAHAEAWKALFANCNVEPVAALRQD